MKCTDCDDFTCESWTLMKEHYAKNHPDVNPTLLFTKEARSKVKVELS